MLEFGQISSVSPHGDDEVKRYALEGFVLSEGHPVRDAWVGLPDPAVKGSQNPIAYPELPEELPYLVRPCACGCGPEDDRDLLPGHDVKAFQDRVRKHFGGSALTFIRWVDQHLADQAANAESSA